MNLWGMMPWQRSAQIEPALAEYNMAEEAVKKTNAQAQQHTKRRFVGRRNTAKKQEMGGVHTEQLPSVMVE